MKSRLTRAALAATLVIAALPVAGSAQVGTPMDQAQRQAAPRPERAPLDAFVGDYVFDSERSDDIGKAINAGIDGMSFITKPIARRRLKATNDPYASVAIARSAVGIATAYDGRAWIQSPEDGTAIKWTREDGEVLDLSTAMKGDTLVQTFVADDGSRENDFTLSPDGRTLNLDVTIRSPRLPRPVRYRLVYTRRG